MRVRSLRYLAAALAAVVVAGGAFAATASAVTDAEVRAAIEKGRQYLVGLAKPNGSFGGTGGGPHEGGGGQSCLVFMTLAYMREHPNRDHMAKGMDFILNLDADRDFETRQGYGVPIRVMGLSYVHNKLLGDKRTAVRQKMTEDVMRLQMGQATNGGWRYLLKANQDYDFSVSQWPILAMREANLVGIEFPTDCLKKARDLYYKKQNPADGGWHYQDGKSYGSMTAAGVASLFIINDLLDTASGCPCRNGASGPRDAESEKRIDRGLEWLSRNFSAANPQSTGTPGNGRTLYWLYCVERVGIASGYKYFGNHDWYREGAEAVLKEAKDGRAGSVSDTCFALLFLYKGRAPILYNKLKFDGVWNAHRRDIANLTAWIERTLEEQFHWQITELRAPLEELHDAPVLYICAESIPNFSDADKKKLRAFTDTGGTILFEASCGSPTVRKWFQDFAREIWPEWALKPLGPDHGVFVDPFPLKQRPEILGIDDGARTFLFYAMDDISCTWQQRSLTAREYLFRWGINLFRYATDNGALRTRLEDRIPPKSSRYSQPIKPGPKTTLRIARVQHGGNWEVGANYGVFKRLAEQLQAKGITIEAVKEAAGTPVTSGGTPCAALENADVAYLAGSTNITLKPEEREALNAFTARGGQIWAEDVTGAAAFDTAFRKLAGEIGWELKLLPPTHLLMTGRMDPGLGFDLTKGVEFRNSMRIMRLNRPYADFFGIYQGEKMIGVYSPLDVLYSMTGYDAYKNKGYKTEDAAAVATNVAVYFSTQK